MSGVRAGTLAIGLALSFMACNDEPRRPLGASCTHDQQCESGRCVNGVCVAPFASDADVTEVDDSAGAEVVTTADLTVVPRALDNDRVARFEFVSDPPGASFECSYDGGPFVPCVSPFEIATSEGEHTLVIRVYWPDGSAEETMLTYTWRVDLTAPVTTLVTVPPALDNASEVTFGFEVSESATSQCRIDDGAWAPCTSPHLVAALGNGPHHFEVASTDDAGNTEDPPASYRWTIDTSPPDTRIDSGPGALVADTSATFRFSSPDAVVAFECALDAEAFAACTSPWQVHDLADGEHNFAVRAIDALGAVDPTPAEWTWVVDTVEPITGLCGAAAGGSTRERPSMALCSAGSPSTVSGEGPFSWTCQGSGGGASATCTANRSCAGGALEWTVDASTCSAPVATTSHGERLAAVDASQPTTGSQTFDCLQGAWAAVGVGTCVTALRGMCGAAHGGDSIAAPTSGLCASGTPTSVSGEGPFVWSCLGVDGGEDARCESDRSCADERLTWEIDGVACSAQVTTAVNGASRNATDVSEPAVGSRVFTCDQGTWEPADAGNCEAVVRGICGDAHGGDSVAPPTTGLCALGTPTAVTGEGPFRWRCLGDNGGAEADCWSDRSCVAESVSWNIDGEICGAGIAAGLHEQSRTVTDGSEPAVGSQTFTCDQGTWVPSASGTCAAVVHGICGGAHGGDSVAPPTQDLCASGTATSVNGDGPFTWSCLGDYGGDDDGCSSNRSCAGESLSWSVDGVSCSASVTAAPSGESRSANDGTEPSVGSQAFECAQGEWEPLGAGTCDTMIHGSCGAAHGGDSLDAPTQGLCASGTPTAVSGDGPFTWSCLGAVGGGSAPCSSDRSCSGENVTWESPNSVCGGSVTAADNDESRTASDTSEPVVGSQTFICDQGQWELSGAGTCVTHGVCGGADGGDSLNAPTSDLCAIGTASNVTGNGPFVWTCSGLDGGSADSCQSNRSCAAGSVGWDSPNSACTGSVTAADTGQSRTATDTTEPVVGSESFTCNQGAWVESGDGTCQTNGVCGSADGGHTLNPPTNNLCATGIASSVTGDGPFVWTCSGLDGGSADSCQSNRRCAAGSVGWNSPNSACTGSVTAANTGQSRTASDIDEPVVGSETFTCNQGAWVESGNGTCQTNGVCGSADGGHTLNPPTNNLCATGTASSVTGDGPFVWTCSGLDGGSADSCQSNRRCAAGSVGWNSPNSACTGEVTAANTGASRTATDSTQPTTGSQSFTCDQGDWELSGVGTCATNGACGGAHGQSTLDRPTINLCSSGNASSVTGEGPFNWTCSGFDGGTTATCQSHKSCGVVSRNWKAGNNSCDGSTAITAHASTFLIRDNASITRGTQPYKCDQGNWGEGETGTCLGYYIESPQDGGQYRGLDKITAYFGVWDDPSSVQCRIYLDKTTPPAWQDCSNTFTREIYPSNTNFWIFNLKFRDSYGSEWTITRTFWNLGD